MLKCFKVNVLIPLLLATLGESRAVLGPGGRAGGGGNWTSCEELLQGSALDAARVLDRAWRVFYTWSAIYEEPYQVRFRVPTPTLVERFLAEARNASAARDSWRHAAFFMESTLDLSALFLPTPTPGILQVITSLVFQYQMDELFYFAMKVVDPGYLLLMNCKFQVVVALAPLDMFPKDTEVEAVAAALGVRNPHGYPHNVRDPLLDYQPAPAAAADDADDEEDLEFNMLAVDSSFGSTTSQYNCACQHACRAWFNPYSVLDDVWVVFYFFAATVNQRVYHFYVPSARRKKLIQKLLNNSVAALPVDWARPALVMKDIRRNTSTLIVQVGDRGQFLRYPVLKKLKPGRLIHPHEIYFKQSEGGKYLSFMICRDESAYVLARPSDIPRRARLAEAAAAAGLRGRGFSYLYHGHRWMPIPEADEAEFPPQRFYMVQRSKPLEDPHTPGAAPKH